MSTAHDIVFNTYHRNGICKNCGLRLFTSACPFVSAKVTIEREKIATEREKIATEREKIATEREKIATQRAMDTWKGLFLSI